MCKTEIPIVINNLTAQLWELHTDPITTTQQRQSRFDQPGTGGGFNGNARGNLPPGGIGGASPGQQVGAVGGNFGGQNMPGNLGGAINTNPRPLMEDVREMELGGDRRGDYGGNPKRPRRF